MRRRDAYPYFCFACVLAALIALCGATAAVAQEVSATAVKAAYLTKFPPFVEWPASAAIATGAPLIVCIVGNDPFGDLLDKIVSGQKADTHPISIRRIKDPDPSCNILYAGSTGDGSVAAELSAVKSAPVLTVTDSDSDGGAHGVICFVRDKNHVRFDIDAGAAKEHGLVISSKLLGLAHKVTDVPGAAP